MDKFYTKAQIGLIPTDKRIQGSASYRPKKAAQST